MDHSWVGVRKLLIFSSTQLLMSLYSVFVIKIFSYDFFNWLLMRKQKTLPKEEEGYREHQRVRGGGQRPQERQQWGHDRETGARVGGRQGWAGERERCGRKRERWEVVTIAGARAWQGPGRRSGPCLSIWKGPAPSYLPHRPGGLTQAAE